MGTGFIPAYSMRAAGDVKFSMILSCTTMWALQGNISVVLCRVLVSPIVVWIGMFSDWTPWYLLYPAVLWKKMADHKVIE